MPFTDYDGIVKDEKGEKMKLNDIQKMVGWAKTHANTVISELVLKGVLNKMAEIFILKFHQYTLKRGIRQAT